MKVFSLWMIGLCALLSVSGMGPAEALGADTTRAGKPVFTKHFKESLFDVTGHARYSTEVLLDDKEFKIGQNVIGIEVHDAADADVIGAELSFVLRNLATGEAATGKPAVTDRKNGLYVVSGLDLMRPGRWEFIITIKKGDVDDSVKFVLPDSFKDRVPKGRYSP